MSNATLRLKKIKDGDALTVLDSLSDSGHMLLIFQKQERLSTEADAKEMLAQEEV